MRSNFLKYIAVLLIVFSICFFYPVFAYGQESKDISITKTDFRDYPKVEIYVNFREGSGLEEMNLTEDDFTVLENGEKVSNLSINGLSEVMDPIGVVLLLDTSGSMEGEPIKDAADAALLFMNEMRSIDEFSVVSFSDSVTIHSNFTSDRRKLRDSISEIEAGGDTALFDGVYTASNLFANRSDIKYRYVIVLSDGMDTASVHSAQNAINKSLQEDTIIYSIALLSAEFNPDSIRNISNSTGGEMLTAASSSDLKELYRTISKRIINQYKISYTSLWPNAEDIEISIGVGRDEITGSTVTSYTNPYYSPEPEEVVIGPERSFYLTLFDEPWMRTVIYAVVFVGIALFLCSLVLFIPVRRKTLRESAGLYGYGTRDEEAEEEYRKERGKSFFGWILQITSRVASRRGYIEYFNSRLNRAGMGIKATEFITFHFTGLVASIVLAYYFSRNLLLTLFVAIVVLLVPFLIINMKTAQRLTKFHEQLPDVLQLMSGSLKAGYSFNQAMEMAVRESRPPVSDEFKRLLSEIRVGRPEKEALGNMLERVNSEYLQWIVTAINVQREVGGNLAEVMDIIANTIRERDRILNRIRALTSEGKLSAIILIVLPIVIGLLLFILNREYISVLFFTRAGLAILALAALLLIIGVVWVMKIVSIKY